MARDDEGRGWLVFLAQLPAAPSSARVALWRRLRAHGATGLLNGAWVLPRTVAHTRFFGHLRDSVQAQGGQAFVLPVAGTPASTDAVITASFDADRKREYDELTERCAAFLAELRKETAAGKFTFAELEENEQDLDKLAGWLARIQARDFFSSGPSAAGRSLLADCRRALEQFAQAVYRAEGIGSGPTSPPPPPPPPG
jgi:hypothetical protein